MTYYRRIVDQTQQATARMRLCRHLFFDPIQMKYVKRIGVRVP